MVGDNKVKCATMHGYIFLRTSCNIILFKLSMNNDSQNMLLVGNLPYSLAVPNQHRLDSGLQQQGENQGGLCVGM